MPKRKTSFEKGHFYHLYNRGANREMIFLEEENYIFLIKRIKKYSLKFDISVLAYCLMPNHYHLLIRQESDKSTSSFIQAIFNSYTKAVNKKYKRTGTLFEGRFKSIHIDEQNYLIHLCSYIHRNPIEAGISRKLGEWPYSNLPEWLNQRNGKLFDKSFRKQHFNSPKEYREFLEGYELPKESKKFLF